MAKKHNLKEQKAHAETHAYLPELIDQFQRREISRRDFLQTATALGMSATAATLVAACGKEEEKPAAKTESQPAASADGVTRGGTLRFGMKLQELKDPNNFQWIESSNVARAVTEYLTFYGPDGVVKPYLAKSWKVSDDGMTFDLRLRKGIKWTNGDEFNADDVVHNFARWRAPDNESINKSEWGDGVVKDVEKVASDHVRLHLAKPDVSVAHRLYAYPTCIVHRSFDDTGADLVKNPVGTGPFTLENFQVGEGALLKRREGYWGGPFGGEGDAYLDAVQFVDLGEDEQASTSALTSKQVDWLYKITPKQLDVIGKMPHVQLLDTVTAQTPVIRFHTDIAPFDNLKLRQAIIHAASNADILKVAYRNQGIAAENHHTAPFQPDYFDLGNPPKQDLKKAAELIEAAGMKDKEIQVTVGNTQGTWEQDTCQVLQQQCAQAGINLQLNVLPTAQYWEVWDTNPFGLTFWTHRPLAVMLHKLAYRSDAKWNETGFKSDTYDRALDAAAAAPDPKAASQHMKTCQQELRDNFVMVQPYWTKVYTGGDKKVKDFPNHPQEYFPLHRVWMES